jgi:molybdopterin synthase catalytic subunit
VYFEVTSEPLDPNRLVEQVRRDEAGAVLLFYGVVRNENLGRRVEYLEYDAYPEMAEKVMRELAEEIMRRWPVTDIAIQHRTGRLEVGQESLLVAVSSPHRKEAFEAGLALVDRFKEVVPIWKKEVFEGGEEWIEGDPSREISQESG